MINKKKKILERFYRQLIRKEKLSYRKALAIYEALYREARALGVISSKNVLDGIETDLRIANVIHRSNA